MSFSPIHVSLATSFRWKVKKAIKEKKKDQRKRLVEELTFFKFHVNQIPNKTTNQLLKILEISSSVLLGYELMVKEKNYNG